MATANALSTEATNLLSVLRSQEGYRVEHWTPIHLPDRILSKHCSMPIRNVIDAARELLNSGVLVLADEHGRWIGTLDEAIAYRDRLLKRVRNTAGRVSALNKAIAAHQQQLELTFRRPEDDQGQLPAGRAAHLQDRRHPTPWRDGR